MELPELETVYTPMRELVRGRLKAALNYAKSNFARGGQTVLVLDQLSKRIISSALTLFEILELGFVCELSAPSPAAVFGALTPHPPCYGRVAQWQWWKTSS